MTWEHIISRRVSINTLIAWNRGLGKLCGERYGRGLTKTLAYFDGNKTDYFFHKELHKKFNKNLDKQLENKEFILSMVPEGTDFMWETYEKVKNLIKNHKNLNNKELAVLFKEFCKLHFLFYTRKDVAWRITHRIEGKLRKQISERKVRELSEPATPNDVTNERIDLLKLAIKKPTLTDHEMEVELLKHQKKYTHIPMFDVDHEPYTPEHFKEQLGKIQKPLEEYSEIMASFDEREQNYSNALEKMLQKAVVYRDYADTTRQRLNLALIPFYAEIGERLGISRHEVVLLTNKEIVEHLETSKLFDKSQVAERKKGFLLIQDDEKVVVYSGEEAERKSEELKLYPEIKGSSIKGIVASKGKASGKAKVIFTNKDLHKVEEGEIMVTTMTRQDFVPYLRKVKAIVTNEGGIGCHAAIMARELNKPCVVGTIVGTRMIKDGDMIEVDANNGVIKKLS